MMPPHNNPDILEAGRAWFAALPAAAGFAVVVVVAAWWLCSLLLPFVVFIGGVRLRRLRDLADTNRVELRKIRQALERMSPPNGV